MLVSLSSLIKNRGFDFLEIDIQLCSGEAGDNLHLSPNGTLEKTPYIPVGRAPPFSTVARPMSLSFERGSSLVVDASSEDEYKYAN